MLWAPRYDLEIASHMAGGFITGLLLLAAFAYDRDAPESRLLRAAAIVFAFVSLALGFIEIFGKVPIARLFQPEGRVDLLLRGPMKGVNVLVTVLPGVAGMMWASGARTRFALAVLVAGVGALALNSNMDANIAGFILAVVGFVAGLALRHHAFRAAAFAIAGLILFAPAIFAAILHLLPPAADLPASWEQRVLIWRSALAHISAHPLFGTGFGTLRETALSGALGGGDIKAQHTHNAGLHVWFETGFVGAALASAALCALALQSAKALRNQPAAAAAATGAIASVAPFAFVSWSIWQEWWVATMFLAAGLAAAVPRRNDQTPET
jgi:O-antigen ligase